MSSRLEKQTHGKVSLSIEDLTINTIRTLAMDAVQQANSGHPGTPMALAPLAYVLWTKIMRYNPSNPNWFNRDRFILSAGHASMLLYAMLYLTGYDLTRDDIKNFRQWESKTPGHPEFGMTPGVETTTGPLGQGFMNAVGMAMAEAHLSAVYNRPDHNIVNHHTYVICSDGDLMEGASHEAASLAGHFGLGRLIVIYDDNRITIEGETNLTYSDDAAKRFAGYGWDVQNIGDVANDTGVIEQALRRAANESERPTLIIMQSHIGFGAPNKQDTPDAHGAPLGAEEVRLTKERYGWPVDEPFRVPNEVIDHMHRFRKTGTALETEWDALFASYRTAHPALAAQFADALKRKLPDQWQKSLPTFASTDKPIATRSASGKVLNALAKAVPWLIGGSADLGPSNKSVIAGEGYFGKSDYSQRNIPWGVREHAMCAASTGMALHGGVQPYASTFFIFTDYARPAIRLAALMEQPVIYLMTHDSIGLGEDGPTHQPVEHLVSLRAMPNIRVIRPADANETAFAWQAALELTTGPTMLVLSRQDLPIFDRSTYADASGTLKGAYILSKESRSVPDIILIATGSEVALTLAAQKELAAEEIDARVVSMPCWEIFREQPECYRREVLPETCSARLAIEAASPFGWLEWVGDNGAVIGIDKFGASAPADENFKQYGFTVDNIKRHAKTLLNT